LINNLFIIKYLFNAEVKFGEKDVNGGIKFYE
jgi:hypothetical protein